MIIQKPLITLTFVLQSLKIQKYNIALRVVTKLATNYLEKAKIPICIYITSDKQNQI